MPTPRGISGSRSKKNRPHCGHGYGDNAYPEQRKAYLDAATLAWRYFDQKHPAGKRARECHTAVVHTTLWDVGAQLLATYSAKELGIINAADYRRRIAKTLGTLEKAPLYRGIAYNRLYSTTNGQPSEITGWSSTDLGRFLAALKILAARDPLIRRAGQPDRPTERLHKDRLRRISARPGRAQRRRRAHPLSGRAHRLYEQYAATGFSQWGAPVAQALDVDANAEPFSVLGVPLVADKRYTDRLLSEPFILLGLEFGLKGSMRTLAGNVLKAQEERFKSTGRMTITTEDAVAEPPDYFYYYCVLCNRKPFVIDLASPGKEQDHPRWVSTKGAYGWDAILPSDYTRRAVAAVAPARDANAGWASGVYESNGQSTKTVDINTSAVMLEIALYKLRGSRPLIESARVQLR